jgi:hypothetical protein
VTSANVELGITGHRTRRRLTVEAFDARALAAFEGTVEDAAESAGERYRLTGPLSAHNAAAARDANPSLRPRPIGLRTSAGTGDRLGLATPGHVAAFRAHGQGVRPIFAQQSIREMDRLGRSPQQVLDDATFGCIQAGWQGAVGADADHLKTTADIDRCLEAGFTLFTIDVGDFVTAHTGSPTARDLADLPWAQLEDDLDAARRRYAELRVDAGTCEIAVSDADLAHAMAKYGRAVAEGAAMYRHLMNRARHEVEVEIAVDETDEPTTAAEHVYIATELARLGVHWVSFAPRHLGTFEKGVEFAGDRDALYASIRTHAGIAAALGPYKIGMHSGSDKFSIYAGVMEATGGLVHLKTSGTSYLVALGIAARFDPALFRRIYDASVSAYRAARASYYVSADLTSVPDPTSVADEDLPSLLDTPATRQILHVGYGAALRTEAGAASSIDVALREVLTEYDDAYSQALADHLGRHLSPFASRP